VPLKSNHLHAVVVAMFWLACAGVATLSLLPVDELPRITLDLWDKAQHAAGFFLLGMLGLKAYPNDFVRVCIGLLLFGALIEVAQDASGWRTGDVLDGLADSVGLALAAAVMKHHLRHRP
jgi:VanZ family protein